MTTANTVVTTAVWQVEHACGSMHTVSDGQQKTSIKLGESYAQWLTRLAKAPGESAARMFAGARQAVWDFNRSDMVRVISVKRGLKNVPKRGLLATVSIVGESGRPASQEELDAWHAKQQTQAARRAEKLQALITAAKASAKSES